MQSAGLCGGLEVFGRAKQVFCTQEGGLVSRIRVGTEKFLSNASDPSCNNTENIGLRVTSYRALTVLTKKGEGKQ